MSDPPPPPPPSRSPSFAAALTARLREAGCVFAEEEAELLLSTPGTAEEVAALAERRAAGEPLEHVLGWAEFCGLRFAVEPGVFVPRRRTEFLVRQAARIARPGDVVVDLCCGSGALGAALASTVAGTGRGDGTGRGTSGAVELYAADVDPVAVRCARRNVAAAGGRVFEGDLCGALPSRLRGGVDVMLANVPYVPTDSVGLLPSEARDHEPESALDGGADGLDVLRRVAAEAASWLAPGGSLFVETSEAQVASATRALKHSGLTARTVRCEEWGATVLVAGRPGGAGGGA